MVQLIEDRSPQRFQIQTFKGRDANVWIDERRWVWAPLEVWGNVLVMPAPLRPRLFSGMAARAKELQGTNGEPYHLTDARGEQWFRWHVIEDGISGWYYRIKPRIDENSRVVDDNDRLFFENVTAIKRWGWDIQERALQGQMAARASTAPANSQAALTQAMSLLAGVSQDHEKRLQGVESIVHRDLDEFIDVKSFLLERGKASETMPKFPQSRETLGALLGRMLSERGAEKGPKVSTRLDGCAVIKDVNTYRRRDLAAALGEIK